MTIHTNTLVEVIESGDESVTFTYGESGEGEVQWLVIAAGRGPEVEALGLDAAGVKLSERGLIEVDGAMRTSVEGVYAIGSLVPGPALAYKAPDEGVIAAEDAAGMQTHPIEYIDVPRATFCPQRRQPRVVARPKLASRTTMSSSCTVQHGAVGAGTV